MEQAIHELYATTAPKDERSVFRQVHEYPIGGRPPMMTHIFSNAEGVHVIAAKGAAEAILILSHLPEKEKESIQAEAMRLASQGYRVLGVGRGLHEGTDWPAEQQAFRFVFLGLLAFFDPPKEHIRETLQTFSRAGIDVKMITGDYPQTARAIASQVGLTDGGRVISGSEVMDMDAFELQRQVGDCRIFARMFPEAKLKVIEALRQNGEVVAMTGDGVNDGPALKAAHIGIAMGKRGSEVAKSAASLILTDDNLSHMADAVALGRKIYDNLKKAIRYIVSIHIPIILIVTLPLLLGWDFTAIFSPVHVIFLELIMGPTCSIIYENEPMEAGTMNRPPRRIGQTFLSFRQLILSLVQGLVITAGCLGIGYHYLQQQATPEVVRTVIFITLLFSNVWLTLVNRSFVYSILQTSATGIGCCH
jgi:Ca2+-transporting ATPase